MAVPRTRTVLSPFWPRMTPFRTTNASSDDPPESDQGNEPEDVLDDSIWDSSNEVQDGTRIGNGRSWLWMYAHVHVLLSEVDSQSKLQADVEGR